MLSLLFKEPLNEDQDELLFNEFKEFPLKYEHDISSDIDTKLSVFIGDGQVAQKKSEELKLRGLKFISQIHHGRPFFHEKFVTVAESETSETQENSENSENVPQFKYAEPATPPERKPTVRCNVNPSPTTPVAPQLQTAKYVTADQFDALSKKTRDQLNEFSIQLMSRVEAMSATALNATRMAASSPGFQNQLPPTVQVRNTPISTQFKAKNELIANGIRCEKCGKTVRDVEPITKLMMAVREHVMTHFDSENPRLKRFECRECPDFQTNFVDDFEKHLKRHGSMSSLPEKRQKLTVSLLTTTHLELIAKLSNACFPDVFEKIPPPINTILAVETPIRSKVSIFPRLDRLYCSKYNIPNASSGHSTLPAAMVKID